MPHLALSDWFDSDLGQYVFRTECRMLAQLLPGFFGYHLLQLSVQDEQMFCSSPVRAKVAVSMALRRGAGLVASPPSLPFANDSLDVVLVHHLLDFVESPQDILREIGRVTAPAGNLVIVGFNPVSAWGIWQRLARSRGCVPWTGHFIRPRQLMDWLDLLGFKIDQARYAIYRPPLAPSSRRLGKHAEAGSRNLNLPVGSVYLIAANKQVGATTLIRPAWETRRAFGRLSMAGCVRHERQG